MAFENGVQFAFGRKINFPGTFISEEFACNQLINFAGTLKMVDTSEANIYAECRMLLTNPEEYTRISRATNPYGDGFASVRIADILTESLNTSPDLTTSF